MSIPVAITDLREAIERYGFAYLLTVRDDLRAHVVAVDPVWDDDELCTPVGRGTASNATTRPSVSLCYPPVEVGGYSLIIDGEATVDGHGPTVRVRPTGAVLHRPAVPGAKGSVTGCANDCVPVGST